VSILAHDAGPLHTGSECPEREEAHVMLHTGFPFVPARRCCCFSRQAARASIGTELSF